MSEIGDLIIIFILGLILGLVIGLCAGVPWGYKDGQIDYQVGIVKYEIRADGTIWELKQNAGGE